ncbi:MAG: MATE family efflux transporter [Chloroflexi bacterium]|nr:MATE family efflux transporter [Chloroflexota bacterium]
MPEPRPRTLRAETMGTAPMWFLLLQMSFPPMLAIIVMALYSIVDRAFVGNVIGVDALSGLSAAFPAQIAAVAIGLLPGLGGMSVASRALGARDTRQASRVIGSSLAILAPVYLAVTVAGVLRLDDLTALMGASSDTAPYAREYLVIILPGGIFTMLAVAANNLFMAEGRPGSATVVLAGGAVANVILDALFILVFGWGITGAAAATVLAQGLAVTYVAWFYLTGRSALNITLDALRPRFRLIQEIIALGLPIFIIEAARSIVVVVINNILAQYQGGDAYIALFGVINAVLEFALAPFIGVALAYLPLAAYNYGARNYRRIREAIWQSCLGATICGALMIAVLLPLSGHIIRLFAETNALPPEAANALRVALIALPIVGIEFVSSVAFQALGKAWPSVVLTVVQRVVFLLIWVFTLSGMLGVWGVWWSFPVTDISAMFLGFVALALVWRRAEKWGEADYHRRVGDFDGTAVRQ